jgi:cytochrome b subunit of formate dehydrogenase/nitrate/TMAO reductase-like tetraheme cytochrome c subunit
MRPFRTALLLIAGWLLMPLSVVGQELCLECHEVELTSPTHGAFDCADCHHDVDQEVHPDDPVLTSSRELCTGCHELFDGLVDGAHTDVECSDCHGTAHDLLGIEDRLCPMAAVMQIQVCGGCHEDKPELMTGYLGSEHGKALLVSGLVLAPSCSDCHGAHDIYSSDDARARISPTSVPKTCGECHQGILDTWTEMSAHGMAWAEGNAEAPTCVTCHTSHQIHEPTSAEERRAFPESCGNCHDESLNTFRDSFHGHATDLGFMTAAICSDCHTPHANLPADDPRSSIHPDNVVATCGNCHDEPPASWASFDPHAHPEDKDHNFMIWLVWFFMHSLLLGVVTFFLVHDTLWLQRSVVGLVRKEHGTKHLGSQREKWIRRFDRKGRRLHLTVISTFILLALTGLPLKFHGTGWAKGLAELMGGVETTSFIHRTAALATFGYFLFHLFDLTRRAIVGKEQGLFYGWSSMVPRPKDFVDLFNNLKYYLYMGPMPRFDRWTYWEKFDYFAVFWGVIIIGTSGLVLWFPGLSATLLPGWSLNAAYIIHSEEAFLAIGFIFVFHFFHTHLRPHSFPMDTVIFLGSQPLERMKEERPLEYQRLVDSGKLEEYLVDPPSKRRIRNAYAIGFTALTVGLLLALLIIWALIMNPDWT